MCRETVPGPALWAPRGGAEAGPRALTAILSLPSLCGTFPHAVRALVQLGLPGLPRPRPGPSACPLSGPAPNLSWNRRPACSLREGPSESRHRANGTWGGGRRPAALKSWVATPPNPKDLQERGRSCGQVWAPGSSTPLALPQETALLVACGVDTARCPHQCTLVSSVTPPLISQNHWGCLQLVCIPIIADSSVGKLSHTSNGSRTRELCEPTAIGVCCGPGLALP